MFVWRFGSAASLRPCDLPSLSFRSPYLLASIVKDNSVCWSWKCGLLGKPAIPFLWLLWLSVSYCHLAGTTESRFHNNWMLCFAASCFFNWSLFIYLATLQYNDILCYCCMKMEKYSTIKIFTSDSLWSRTWTTDEWKQTAVCCITKCVCCSGANICWATLWYRIMQLTFERPAFTYVNACWKMFQEIYFIYLGNKEIYCNFKMYCIISVSFSTKFCLFLTFIPFCSHTMFFVNHALTFKYQPGRIKVKIGVKPT